MAQTPGSPGFTPIPPTRRGPLVVLVAMVFVFLVLVGILAKGLMGDERANGTTGSNPDSVGRGEPATGEAALGGNSGAGDVELPMPQDSSFSARNLALGGNLEAVAREDGQPIGLDDATARVARLIAQASVDSIRRRATQLPPVADLLAASRESSGHYFTLRGVPFEVNDHSNVLAEGRVASWRIYVMLQRSREEFVVLETLEEPPSREWTLKRDVVEFDVLYLRTATYETTSKREGERRRTVPYFVVKGSRLAQDVAPVTPSGIGALLGSRYGPYVAVGIALFAALTFWTIRRHARSVDALERNTFYAHLRARKRPSQASKVPARPAGGDADAPSSESKPGAV